MIMRYIDSPDLFGNGCGSSSCGEIICEFCGTVHNKEIDDETEGEYIRDTNFAGLSICECCFERIENEILHRMPDILKWYKSIIDEREKRLKNDKSLLDGIMTEK